MSADDCGICQAGFVCYPGEPIPEQCYRGYYCPQVCMVGVYARVCITEQDRDPCVGVVVLSSDVPTFLATKTVTSYFVGLVHIYRSMTNQLTDEHVTNTFFCFLQTNGLAGDRVGDGNGLLRMAGWRSVIVDALGRSHVWGNEMPGGRPYSLPNRHVQPAHGARRSRRLRVVSGGVLLLLRGG